MLVVVGMLLQSCGASEEEIAMLQTCEKMFLATQPFTREEAGWIIRDGVGLACIRKIDFYMDGKADDFLLYGPEEMLILNDNPKAWCKKTPTCGGRR
jgi:hypothetical protein